MRERPDLGTCDVTPVRFDAAIQGFHFDEPNDASGCAEPQWTLNTTGKAIQITLRFQADRRSESFAGLGMGGGSFRQRLAFYDENMQRLEERVIFASTEGAQAPTWFDFRFAIAAGQANVTWGWPMEELNGGFGTRYQSTVRGLGVHVWDLELPSPSAAQIAREVDGNVTRHLFAANVSLPVGWTPEPNGTLRVTISDDYEFQGVLAGPDDEKVNESQLERLFEGGRVTMRLPNSLITSLGHEEYRFLFSHSVTAAPLGTPNVHETVYPVAYAALAAPLLALPLAGHASWRYARERSIPRLQRMLPVAATTVTSAVYGSLAWFTFDAHLVETMASLPWIQKALLLYLMFLLLFVVGLALWFLTSRFLIHAVRRQVAQRDALLADLRRSNEDLQQFAYITSHDLREPLRTIAGYAHLIEADLGPSTNGATEYLAYIKQGTVRMRALIDGLLEYARVQTHTSRFKHVSLNQVVDEAVAALGTAIGESRAVVTRDDLPVVVGDDVQLRSVVQNLLDNAIKFRHPSRRPKVHFGATREENGSRVTVSDNGIGFDLDQRDRIFQIFARLHSRDAYPGTGIGLAITKRIIEGHGGHIGADSKPKKGSTFWFTLPTVNGTVVPTGFQQIPTASAD